MRCQVASLDAGAPASPVAVARSLGLRGLYGGFFATLARETPFGAIVLPLYPALLHFFSGGDAKPPVATMLACGIASGGCAAAITCPIDVIKTRLQLAAGSAAPGTTAPSAAAVVAATLKEDGPRGFFRGVGPRVSIFSGLYGVLFLSYEFANKLLGI